MKEYWRLLLNANIGKRAWIYWGTHCTQLGTVKKTDNYCVILENNIPKSNDINTVHISLSAITAVDIRTHV